MNEKKMPLSMVVGRLMHELDRAMIKATSDNSDIKLTVEQFGLLHLINLRDQPYVQQDLANILGKDKSAILRLIDQLQQKKLVIRVVDSTDRRKNCLHVTELGKKVMLEYVKMEARLSQELTSGISEDDLTAFYRVISVIRRNADER